MDPGARTVQDIIAAGVARQQEVRQAMVAAAQQAADQAAQAAAEAPGGPALGAGTTDGR